MAYQTNTEYIEPKGYGTKKEGYIRNSANENYGRKTPITHIAPFLDSLVMDSIDYRPGLRGLCYPGTGIIKVRRNDDEPAKVNEHENLHETINRVNPYHSEWEVRDFVDWRWEED